MIEIGLLNDYFVPFIIVALRNYCSFMLLDVSALCWGQQWAVSLPKKSRCLLMLSVQPLLSVTERKRTKKEVCFTWRAGL